MALACLEAFALQPSVMCSRFVVAPICGWLVLGSVEFQRGEKEWKEAAVSYQSILRAREGHGPPALGSLGLGDGAPKASLLCELLPPDLLPAGVFSKARPLQQLLGT